MNRRRVAFSGFFPVLIVVAALLAMHATAQAEDPPATAVAADSSPPAPDPTRSPTEADSTGVSYTGANTTAGLTGDKDPKTGKVKVTLDSLAADVKASKIGLNIFWTLITGFLVMFMQAGFALVETGLTRAKNVAHTMTMNFAVYGIGMVGFWICGFGLMFGGLGPVAAFDGPNILDHMISFQFMGKTWDVLGFKGFLLGNSVNDATVLTMFLFQMVFMDTTVTIPTGAMAERWKFSAFVVYGFFISMIIYPVYGCWVWGGGWLSDLGVNFGLGNGHVDFAGSSVVHMTGGVTALAGAIVLGPRIGKFNRDGSANAMPAHNIPMVVLGTLILGFGWFGFNPGSTLAATDLRISSVAVCTMLATATGMLSSMAYMWIVFGKPDPTMCCNGFLAGAVAITAPCAFVNPAGAAIIGGIAGVLVVGSVLFIERVLKVDDPVGAISVHGVCGAFGCLSIGLFADGHYGAGWNGVATAPLGLLYGGGLSQLAAEAIGVLANILWVFPVSYIFFKVVQKTMGIRVSAQIEVEGLDIPEMGVLGYMNEDPIEVSSAGRTLIATHGPGVPTKENIFNPEGKGNPTPRQTPN